MILYLKICQSQLYNYKVLYSKILLHIVNFEIDNIYVTFNYAVYIHLIHPMRTYILQNKNNLQSKYKRHS